LNTKTNTKNAVARAWNTQVRNRTERLALLRLASRANYDEIVHLPFKSNATDTLLDHCMIDDVDELLKVLTSLQNQKHIEATPYQSTKTGEILGIDVEVLV